MLAPVENSEPPRARPNASLYAAGNNRPMNRRNFMAPILAGLYGVLAIFGTAAARGMNSPTLQLPVTAALITLGGGAGEGSFSSVRAFSQMIGADPLQSEMATLRAKFGSDAVDRFVHIFDYAFIDGWQRAGQANLKMPAPTSDTGTALALDMIRAGTGRDGAFQITTMMDALWSPRVHQQIHSDIATKFGSDALSDFVRVGNQFFSDLAQSLHSSPSK